MVRTGCRKLNSLFKRNFRTAGVGRSLRSAPSDLCDQFWLHAVAELVRRAGDEIPGNGVPAPARILARRGRVAVSAWSARLPRCALAGTLRAVLGRWRQGGGGGG